jgi:hypothetical protein
MKRIWPAIRTFLWIWGVFSLVGVAVIGISVLRRLASPGSIFSSNRESSAKASKHDVRFVLNGCRLGEERYEAVVHSYISARSFTGDHLDAHAIRITHVSTNELKRDDCGSGWVRCVQVDGVLDDALKFVEGWTDSDDIKWFPSIEEIRTSEFYVHPLRIYCHGTRPGSVELIFLRPSDRMLYYFDCKT